jgi:hypothetical protein
MAVLVALCVTALLPVGPAEAAASTPDPFASFAALVEAQYQDLLGVAPTAAQRSAAIAALTAGTQSPGGLVATLRHSDDHVKNVDPVTRLYRAFLLRIPDKGGLEFWINRRRSGTWTLTRIADSFATSNEFKTRYGKLSNRDFVKLIYDNVLERSYDSTGLDFWTRQLDQKRKSRGAVMANFSESNEYKTKQAAEVDVSVLNVMLLRRAPTKTEFTTAVTAIEAGSTTASYATELMGTTQYASRFNASLAVATPSLPPLYVGVPMQTVLSASGGFGDRSWSATGLPAWASLDAVTGTLSGTPLAQGTVTITAKVTAGAGMTGTKAIALNVKAGMPPGCITSDCAQLDTAAGTVQIQANAVTGVVRNGNDVATSVALSAAAPSIAVGSILVIAPGADTPTGLIVKVTSFTGTNGSARTAVVIPSTLTDAYANGIVQGTGTTPVPDRPFATTRSTRAAGCSGNADIDITPTATVGLQPKVTLLWGNNVAGFGDVFVGTGGVKLFQFGLDGDLSFKLKGSMTGSVDCSLDVPGVTIPISLGPAGFLFFKLTPSLGLKATAGIEIDTTVTVHCGLVYAYQEGSEFRSQYCNPTYTPPKVSTANTGADLTVSGGVTTSLTFNDLVGLNGTLTASAHAGYHPLAHPIGVLDGKVIAKLSACLACAFGNAAPSLTILDKTIWEKTFATWDTPSTAPQFPRITSTSLPVGTVGAAYSAPLTASGGQPPYTWTATGLPAGLSLAGNTITGTPTALANAPVTVRLTDAAGSRVSRSLTLAITRNGDDLQRVAEDYYDSIGGKQDVSGIDVAPGNGSIAYSSTSWYDSSVTRIQWKNPSTGAFRQFYQQYGNVDLVAQWRPQISADGSKVVFIVSTGKAPNQRYSLRVGDTADGSYRDTALPTGSNLHYWLHDLDATGTHALLGRSASNDTSSTNLLDFSLTSGTAVSTFPYSGSIGQALWNGTATTMVTYSRSEGVRLFGAQTGTVEPPTNEEGSLAVSGSSCISSSWNESLFEQVAPDQYRSGVTLHSWLRTSPSAPKTDTGHLFLARPMGDCQTMVGIGLDHDPVWEDETLTYFLRKRSSGGAITDLAAMTEAPYELVVAGSYAYFVSADTLGGEPALDTNSVYRVRIP